MRKITKLMLTLVLLAAGVVGVNAKKYYADLSTGSAVGNATWTAETNTFAWTASSYAYMVVSGGSFSGDLSEYTTIGLNVSGLVNEFRVDILANGKTFTGKAISTEGAIVLNILSDFNLQWNPDKITTEDLKSVTAVRLNTNSDSGSAVITKFYIAKPATLLFDDSGTANLDLTDLVTTGGLTFDEQTGVLTNDGTGGTLYVNMPSDGIDFTNMLSMTVNRSGDDIIGNSEIKDTKNGISNGFWGSKYGVNFTTGDAMKFNNATNVNSIIWYGNNTAGSMTISSIVFKANVVTCTLPGSPVVLNTLQYHNFPDGTDATAAWNVGKQTDTYYGSGSSTACNYVDLTGYEELRIQRDTKIGFRAFFIKSDGTGTNQIDNKNTNVSWDETESSWVIDLSKVEKYQGKTYLNTIKSEGWGVNNIVNNITVYKTPEGAANYILAGKGTFTPEVEAALADANATYIDATGITGATLLTSANPNCMFTASADGMVTNAQNVIVNGTCANLVLTDGYDFKAPANFTATTASYTTTINATAKAGTLCLPFAATLPTGVTAYTLAYNSGDEATATEVTTTIPANTPVLLNGAGAVTFSGSGAVAANAENKSKAMTGVFAKGFVPKDSYVLQLLDSGLGFRKVADDNSVSINPFRAYLTAQGAGSRLGINFGGVTGIETVATAQQNGGQAYDLQGRRVAQPAKGLYIVNGKKYIVK